MNSKFLIYCLHHDASEHVYVGRSSSGMVRPRTHFRESEAKKHAQLPVYKWLGRHKKDGREPQITVLEECRSSEDLNEAERFHIAYFKSLGISLLNCTDGGEGMSGLKASAETRAKMSATHKALKRSPEQLAASADRLRRYHATEAGKANRLRAQQLSLTPESLAKRSVSLKVNAQRPEGRAQILAAQVLSKTPEALAKLSSSKKGKKFSDEHRANLSKAHIGITQSPESIEKRASQLRGKKRPLEVMEKSWAATRIDVRRFDGVDWSLPNRVIGASVGASHGLVGRVRQRLGIAPSTHARTKKGL